MNGYEIVEKTDGGGRHYPIIQAVLDDDWFPPVQAFEYHPADGGDPYWLMIVDPNVVQVSGTDRFPAAAVLASAEHAREWVALIAGLYVKAAA